MSCAQHPIIGAMKLLFERSEYLARIARTKKAMAERGIDLLLVASPANQFWLTGYDGWSFYTPQMVALRIDQEEPIWVGRKMDAVGAKFTAFLEAGERRALSRHLCRLGRAPSHAVPRRGDHKARLGQGNRGRRERRLLLHRQVGRDPAGRPAQRALRGRVPAGQPLPHEEARRRSSPSCARPDRLLPPHRRQPTRHVPSVCASAT